MPKQGYIISVTPPSGGNRGLITIQTTIFIRDRNNLQATNPTIFNAFITHIQNNISNVWSSNTNLGLHDIFGFFNGSNALTSNAIKGRYDFQTNVAIFPWNCISRPTPTDPTDPRLDPNSTPPNFPTAPGFPTAPIRPNPGRFDRAIAAATDIIGMGQALEPGECLIDLFGNPASNQRSMINGAGGYNTGAFFLELPGQGNMPAHEFGHILGLADRYTYLGLGHNDQGDSMNNWFQNHPGGFPRMYLPGIYDRNPSTSPTAVSLPPYNQHPLTTYPFPLDNGCGSGNSPTAPQTNYDSNYLNGINNFDYWDTRFYDIEYSTRYGWEHNLMSRTRSVFAPVNNEMSILSNETLYQCIYRKLLDPDNPSTPINAFDPTTGALPGSFDRLILITERQLEIILNRTGTGGALNNSVPYGDMPDYPLTIGGTQPAGAYNQQAVIGGRTLDMNVESNRYRPIFDQFCFVRRLDNNKSTPNTIVEDEESPDSDTNSLPVGHPDRKNWLYNTDNPTDPNFSNPKYLTFVGLIYPQSDLTNQNQSNIIDNNDGYENCIVVSDYHFNEYRLSNSSELGVDDVMDYRFSLFDAQNDLWKRPNEHPLNITAPFVNYMGFYNVFLPNRLFVPNVFTGAFPNNFAQTQEAAIFDDGNRNALNLIRFLEMYCNPNPNVTSINQRENIYQRNVGNLRTNIGNAQGSPNLDEFFLTNVEFYNYPNFGIIVGSDLIDLWNTWSNAVDGWALDLTNILSSQADNRRLQKIGNNIQGVPAPNYSLRMEARLFAQYSGNPGIRRNSNWWNTINQYVLDLNNNIWNLIGPLPPATDYSKIGITADIITVYFPDRTIKMKARMYFLRRRMMNAAIGF